MNSYKFGVIGLGWISNEFCEALNVVPMTELHAVGSRSLEKAKEFAKKHYAANAYGSYEDVYNDSEVDIVYIGTPMSSHFQNMLDIIEAGKHIICEKSFTLNHKEAQIIKDKAHQKGVVVMEALWTRFNPTIKTIQEIILSGEIGEIERIDAEFSIYRDFDEKSRIFNNELGGGALLDVGIYPITFTDIFIGLDALEIDSSSELAPTGVDIDNEVRLNYGNKTAKLIFGVNREGENYATIYGTEGRVVVKDFWATQNAEVHLRNGKMRTINIDFIMNGLEYEIMHFIGLLESGKAESDIMPLNKTIEIMKFMDNLRDKWGVEYVTELK